MSDDRDDDITLEMLLERHRDAMAEELHTAMPGRVESYDAESQTADVKPMIRRAIPRADGTIARDEMPVIRAVPVCHPRWGDFFVHAPLAAGDFVMLVVCERDLAQWRQTGALSDPLDTRAHHLAHAVAIPGLYPRPLNLSAKARPADALVIGRVSGESSTRIVIQADGVVVVESSQIRLGSIDASDALVSEPELQQHLSKISMDLEAIAIVAGTTATNYGTVAKEALDLAQPIATAKVTAE